MRKKYILFILFFIFLSGCSFWKREDTVEILNVSAVKLYNQGKYYESLDVFEQALEQYTGIKELYYNEWLAYNALKQYHQALANFDEALMIDPQYTDALAVKAWTLSQIWEYHDALKLFDTVLLQDPTNKYALNNEWYVRYQLWEKQNALDLYNQVLKQDENFAPALINKALVMAEMGSWESSLAYFDKAIASTSWEFLYYYNKATVLSDLIYQLKDKQDESSQSKLKYYADEAFRLLDKVLLLKPWYLDAQIYQVIIHYDMKEYASCLEMTNKILQKDPQHKDALHYQEKCENP